MRLKFPTDISFECSKCGLCCGDTPLKKRSVLLLKSDADHISQATGLTVDSFALPAENFPYVYEMKKTPQGKCVFLQESQCKVYETRPLICRFYPFELSTNTKGTFVFKATEECPEARRQNSSGNRKVLDKSFYKALLELARADLGSRSF